MSSTSIGSKQRRRVAAPAGGLTAKSILARLDRMSVWSIPFMFIGITRGRYYEEISP